MASKVIVRKLKSGKKSRTLVYKSGGERISKNLSTGKIRRTKIKK